MQAFSRHVQEQPDSTALVHAGHQVTYADLERLTRRATADLDGGTTALSFSPLNFDLALLDVWTVLEAGGTVVVADAGASGDAGYLRDLAQRYEVTLVQGVPPGVRGQFRGPGLGARRGHGARGDSGADAGACAGLTADGGRPASLPRGYPSRGGTGRPPLRVRTFPPGPV
ncbi:MULTISPECIES: AMP-binding protein [Streptomyces griseus group]|uniref:AMP-binding protein n=1 Tax=Streptomyces griseus group TaxID=629295 RepID=UPI001F3B3A7E|nr:AMP-binding protein [Streptomyces baarnensis]